MSGGVGQAGKKGITPGYKIRVVLDDWIPVVVRPYECLYRRAEEMCKADGCFKSLVVLKPYGWQLQSYLTDRVIYSDVQTVDSVETPGVLSVSGGGVLMAPGYDEINTAGPTRSGDTRPAGYKGHKKRVTGSASLTSDQTGFPASSTSLRGQTMDRAGMTTANHDVDKEFLVQFVNTGDKNKHTKPRRILFQGPLYSTTERYGTGDWQLDISDDGQLDVFVWTIPRSTGPDAYWQPFTSRRVTAGHLTTCNVHIQTFRTPRGKFVLAITVTGAGVLAQHDLDMGNAHDAVGGRPGILAAVAPSYQAVLAVPQHNSTEVAVPTRAPQPLRVEVGHRERATIHFTESHFHSPGQIEDQWDFTFPRLTTETITVYWRHHKPTGTDISVEIRDRDHMGEGPITLLASHSYDNYGYVTFHPTHSDSWKYKVTFTLTTDTDRNYTPTVHDYFASAVQVYDTPDVNSFEIARKSVPTTPGEGDPPTAAENANGHYLRLHRNYTAHDGGLEMLGGAAAIEVHDLDGSGMAIRRRGLIAAKILCDYPDPAHPETTKTAMLWRGYTTKPQSYRKKKRTGKSYPSDDWHQANLTFVPETIRLKQSLGRIRFPWLNTDGSTYKVTDRIRALAQMCYPEAYVSIDDIGVPLPADDAGIILQPQANLGDIIEADARDFFSASVDYDKGADVIRMIRPPLAANKPLARFLTKTKVTSSTVTSGSGNTVPCVGVKFTPVMDYEEPLVNSVVVVGAMSKEDATDRGQKSAGVMVQKAYRFQSCNFFGLAATHRFYPRPIQPADATASSSDHTVTAFKTADYLPYFAPLWYKDYISDPKLMNHLTRRIYLNCCFGRKVCVYQAPTVFVTDPDDVLQIRERELRKNDVVEFEDPQTHDIERWIVRRCTIPKNKKAFNMWETYEIVKMDWPSGEAGIIENHRSVIDKMKRTAKVALGAGADSPTYGAAAQASSAFTDRFGGMVHETLPPIQNVDPSSDDFGNLLDPPTWS